MPLPTAEGGDEFLAKSVTMILFCKHAESGTSRDGLQRHHWFNHDDCKDHPTELMPHRAQNRTRAKAWSKNEKSKNSTSQQHRGWTFLKSVARQQTDNHLSMARKSTFFADFKAFINKGNVVDLAVAVIIAGAFGKVVDSTVRLIMTNALEPALKKANVDSLAQLPGGSIIVASINFIVIAFVCFVVVRIVEKMKRKEEVVNTSKPDPQVQLTSAITRLTEVMEQRLPSNQ